MSIISKPTNLGPEATLLYEILKQIDRLIGVTSTSGGGGGGSGTVTSVTGTADRITITGTATVAPIVNIAATYAGQSSITTVGTLTGGTTGAGFTINLTTSTISGILPIANGGTGSATQTAWLLASGGTLTGANTITGTTTNIIKYVFNTLGITRANGAGLWLANNTAAATGAQQISPSLVLEGQGWKTTATAASQPIRFSQEILPVEGTTNPTGHLYIKQSVNNAAYTDVLRLPTDIVNSSAIYYGTNWTINGTNAVLSFGNGIGNIRFIGGSGTITYNSIAANATGHISLRNAAAQFLTPTSGVASEIGLGSGFKPTSGTATYNTIVSTLEINQTGGANGKISIFNIAPIYTAAGGDVSFLDYAPTVTSITGVHYALRATSGNVLVGGTTLTTSAILDLQSTTRAFIPPRMTTTQRDAIASPSAGMMIYNTSTNKLNVFTTVWETVTSL